MCRGLPCLGSLLGKGDGKRGLTLGIVMGQIMAGVVVSAMPASRMKALVQVLVAPFPVQLLLLCLRKQMKDGPSAQALSPTWETRMEF